MLHNESRITCIILYKSLVFVVGKSVIFYYAFRGIKHYPYATDAITHFQKFGEKPSNIPLYKTKTMHLYTQSFIKTKNA